MLQVKGVLKSNNPDFTGHQVILSYNEKVPIDRSATQFITKASEQRTDISANGTFGFTVPDMQFLEEPVSVKVAAPDGELLWMKQYPSPEYLTKEIVIEMQQVGNKSEETRLGFAVLFKFFQYEARFHFHKFEVAICRSARMRKKLWRIWTANFAFRSELSGLPTTMTGSILLPDPSLPC